MTENLNHCPACGNGSSLPWMECTDYTVSREKFRLNQCTRCNLIYTNPRPDTMGISKYYQSEEYISHSNTNKGLINKLYRSIREITRSGKIKRIEQLVPQRGKLLDYGCGTGEFLATAKSKGWVTEGIEPEISAREQALQNHGLNIKTPAQIVEFQNDEFDVITLWHVLEHVHDLHDTLSQFHRILNKNGYLVIAVPNVESTDAQSYKEFWAAYDVPRHLYHFSMDSLSQLMDSHHFSLVSTGKLFFDPFYISMLSEKYKSGSINYLNAFMKGLQTTLKGRKNIRANSSLVYVFHKKV